MEQASGAVDLEFLHAGFTNAYINVTNVVLVITPAAAKADTPAVLVNAHFDSTLGSPGVASPAQTPERKYRLCNLSAIPTIACLAVMCLQLVTLLNFVFPHGDMYIWEGPGRPLSSVCDVLDETWP